VEPRPKKIKAKKPKNNSLPKSAVMRGRKGVP